MAIIACILSWALAQEPSEELQRSLTLEDPRARFSTAQELAGMDEEWVEEWVLRELDQGSPIRQRSLLLSCALRGTPESLEALLKSLPKGRRADSARAWSLLLLGMRHPQAALDPNGFLQKAATPFEKDCFLVGLSAASSPVFSVRDSRALKGRKGSPHRGVMNLLDELAGRPVSWAEPMSAPELGSRLLCSTLPGRKGVTPEELSLADELLDGRWTIGSNRRVSQTSGGIRSQPLFKEEGAVALTLGQVLDGERQEVFEFLNERLAGMPAQRWLWGIAVDLGLELPSQADAPLHEYEAGALLRWAAQDEEKGALQASHFRLQARLDWDQHPQLDRSWPSLAVLALAPEAKDLQLLRGLAEGLTPGQERLQLLWQLASGRLSRDAESALLHQWARELGIGVAGYLDDQGPCWAAAYLITGTLAAEGVARLQPPLSSFERDLDHSPGNQLYADIAEVLLSGVFRWNPLP